MDNKRYQIFISSTFEDLKEERRIVTEQIWKLGHIPVGMELFHAGNEDQWSFIKERIAECDYYIVIIAERYGSQAADGFSYTEKEYRLATELGVPVAAFLLSDEARKTWPASHVEHDQIEKINAFRALCENKLVKYWEDKKGLALDVTNSIVHLTRRHPRPGLVRADKVDSSETLATITRLSEENNKLEEELQNFRNIQNKHQLSQDEKDIVSALKEVDILSYARAHGMDTDSRSSSIKCKKVSVFDLALHLYINVSESFYINDYVHIIYRYDKGALSEIHENFATFMMNSLLKLGIIQGEIHNSNLDTGCRFTDMGKRIFEATLTPKAILLAEPTLTTEV